MPRGNSNQTAEILEYALSHLEKERDEIQARIDHIRRQLGRGGASLAVRRRAYGSTNGTSGHTSPAPTEGQAPPKRKPLSAAARKRIAAAQKKRWAAHRKARKAEAKA